MTATTKEQRESLRRLDAAATAGEWWVDESDLQVWAVSGGPLKASFPICAGALPEDGELMATGRNALPALLSDSDRLAAIEAVTGEEVRELVDRCQEHLTMSKFLRKEHLLARANDDRELSATAILSLSAKVAEQAEEIERLKRHLSDEERQHEQTIHDRDEAEEAVQWLDQQTGGDGEYAFNTLEPHICSCTPLRMCEGIAGRHSVVRAERDTLHRLLTETAVPALVTVSNSGRGTSGRIIIDQLVERKVAEAISTIRAQMEEHTDAPRPARCSACDDTRVIYGHGSFETSCPACHDADAEAGLAMLGGDGRG